MTSLAIRFALAAALCAALVFGYLRWAESLRDEGRDEVRAEHEVAAQLQREANRGRSRDAEVQQTTQAAVRDRFITRTITEVRHVPTACPVLPAELVRLLNHGAECAREDRPASCGADDSVPAPGAAQ